MLAASVIVANADLQSLESRRFGSHSRTAHASSQQPGHTNERSDTGHTAMMHEMLPGPRPPTCCMLVAQQDALHNFVGVGEGEGAHEHDPPPAPPCTHVGRFGEDSAAETPGISNFYMYRYTELGR